MIWSYTYSGGARHPGLQRDRAALRPARIPAVERARGHPRDALRPGDHVLRPRESLRRASRPAASSSFSTPGGTARLPAPASSRSATGSRIGTCWTSSGESADSRRVRKILADAGLFSATIAKVKLACTAGCDLRRIDEVRVASVVTRRCHRRQDRAGEDRRAQSRLLAATARPSRAGLRTTRPERGRGAARHGRRGTARARSSRR